MHTQGSLVIYTWLLKCLNNKFTQSASTNTNERTGTLHVQNFNYQ